MEKKAILLVTVSRFYNRNSHQYSKVLAMNCQGMISSRVFESKMPAKSECK
jgi:hypothetical protein